MRGPIDYIIVSFESGTFDGEILTALQAAVEKGSIAVLALAVIAKAADGTVTTVELGGDTVSITQSFNLDNSLVTSDDVDEVGDLLENDSAAGLLIIEQLWAKDLKQALLNKGGQLLAEGRIHPEASAELEGKEA